MLIYRISNTKGGKIKVVAGDKYYRCVTERELRLCVRACTLVC